MARFEKGQPRPVGAGRKKGQLNKATVEAQQLKAEFDRRIAEKFGPLVEAHLQAALGVSHMVAKGKDGKWTEVTEPAQMIEVLNAGREYYRISARNPDVRAIEACWNRLWGAPTQAVEITQKEPSQMTDAELAAEGVRLLKLHRGGRSTAA